MLETVQIAYAGTLLGFALALPLSIAASGLFFRVRVTAPVRLLLSVVRTIPSLLWALIFVIALGLGSAAGVLGVAFYTLGYLGKLFYEAFDGVDQDVVEALKGITMSKLFLARHAVIPESSNYLLSQLLFMFEYNIRASTIMGFVGAGGIGFYILGYVQALQYDRLTTALLATLALVLAVEFTSNAIRARFIPRETLPNVLR
jgi:phosphonate transport system permease protein